MIKEKIAEILSKKLGEYVSGEALSSQFGISRTAVWKYIGELRREGYPIHAAPRRGYCLVKKPDLLLPEEVKRYLDTKIMGQKIEYWPVIDSTNRRAKELASQGFPQGTVVVAEEQTGGRGRMENRWFSPPGGIWFSVILKPQIIPQQSPVFTLLASLAVVMGLQDVLTPVPLQIKWPNDVFLGNRKLAGILTEISAEMDRVNYIVIGIGINAKVDTNTFPEELKERIVSLQEEMNQALFLPEILGKILTRMDILYQRVQRESVKTIIEEWRKYDFLKGKKISVDTPSGRVSGKSVGINEQGALILESEEGTRTEVLAGSVIL